MTKVISFASVKGGVGKTTSCVNLAYTLSKKSKVVIFDFDIQMSATYSLGSVFEGKYKSALPDLLNGDCSFKEALHEYKKNLYVIPARDDLFGFLTDDFSDKLTKAISDAKKEKFDFILFDLPTNVGALNLIPLNLSDLCIIPVYSPGGLSILGLRSQIKILGMIENSVPYLVLVTFYDNRKTVCREMVNEALPELNGQVFKTRIRENSKLSQCASLGKSVFEFSKTSNGAKDYESLAREIRKVSKEG